jgi:hypothetical protein
LMVMSRRLVLLYSVVDHSAEYDIFDAARASPHPPP